MHAFSLTAETIDGTDLRAGLKDDSAGACVVFEGWVRDNNDGRSVHHLEYEAYETMALKEGEQILRESTEKFGTTKTVCVHRVGSLEIGDLAVWVGVSAGHRNEAFDACRFIIDELKHRVPIWKKEHYADGESGWVNFSTAAGTSAPKT